MRRGSSIPDVTLVSAVDLFLLRELHPDVYLRTMDPWSRLAARPCWRTAKPLLNVDADLVSRIVEERVGNSTSSHEMAAWMCLGKVRQARGDHAGALDVFNGMVRRDSRDYRAHYNVGLCLVALGRHDEARSALNRVLDIVPGDVRAEQAIVALPS